MNKNTKRRYAEARKLFKSGIKGPFIFEIPFMRSNGIIGYYTHTIHFGIQPDKRVRKKPVSRPIKHIDED